jgi:predicted kinase
MTTYVLMAGLPGTGKSTLAQEISQEVNGIVLSKDVVRAAVFPGRFTDYTRGQDDLCFRMIFEAAEYLAAHRQTEFIFLDGRTFSRGEQIQQAVRAAEDAGCAWRIIHTSCPDSVAEARLAGEVARHLAANRTIELYREVKAHFEAITYPHARIDTSQPLDVCIKLGLAYLCGEGK